MDSNKYMFIIVGAPGSGKSTLARKIVDNSVQFINAIPTTAVCEADDYFYIIGDGEYAWNQKLLYKAHQWCQNKAAKFAEHGKNLVVSNTGIRPRDRKFYFELAAENGYKVVFIHQKSNYGSIHGVPEDAVKRMQEGFTDLTSEEKSMVVTSDEMSDDLASLLAVVGVNYEY